MRRLLLLLTLLATAATWAVETEPRAPTEAEIQLFKEALRNSTQDVDHWAYTETTTIKTSKGRPKPPTAVRFDPSKPYAEQYTALTVNGRPPSAREIRKCREKNEKRDKRAREAAARREGKPVPPKVDEGKFNEDLSRLRVLEDSPERITFEVPVKTNRRDFPIENFQVCMQVNKGTRLVEKGMMRVKKPFRMKMVARINAGDFTVEFAKVDPVFGPVMTRMTGGFGVSFLAIPIDADAESTRTDWQRVKAYDERFVVKMAPLQMLGL